MVRAAPPQELSPPTKAAAPRRAFAPAAVLLGLVGIAVFGTRYSASPMRVVPSPTEAAAPASEAQAAAEPAPGPEEPSLRAETEMPPAQPETADTLAAVSQPPAAEPPAAAAPLLPQSVPLPMPRPPEFRRQAGQDGPARAERRASRRAAATPSPAPAEDDRGFFEKLFGIERVPAPARSYAALETAPIPSALPRTRIAPVPAPDSGEGVAVYDISARTVTLPNGERLEAHSGLGPHMDDPRYVHLPMRGATPPGTYELTEREQLFHGVRAIRMTPVGGSAAIYGRAGILAHSYMLGPSGASNGCVSFQRYEAFLQAYLRGEVRRIVVVTGRGQDAVPNLAVRPPAATGRSARRGTDA